MVRQGPSPDCSTVPAGATHTKRVTFPSSSSTPSRITTQPYISAVDAAPSAAHGLSDHAHLADGVGRRRRRPRLGLGDVLAEEVGALRVRLRVREHDLHAAEVQLRASDQGVGDGVIVLAGDLDLGSVEREAVERRADRALDRVLERHERAVGLALGNGLDGVEDGGLGQRLIVGSGRRGTERVLTERSCWAEVGDSHGPAG